MPKKVVLLAAIALLLFMPGTAAAESVGNERFIKILSSPLGEISFDTQSVKFFEEYELKTLIRVIEVEKKVVFSKFGLMSTLDKRKSAKLPTKGFEDLSYVLIRYQITIDKPRWRIARAVYYSSKGVDIDRYFPSNPKWEDVQDITDSRSSYDIKKEKFGGNITIEKNIPSRYYSDGKEADIDIYLPRSSKEDNAPDFNDSRPSYDKIMEYVKAHYYIPSPRKEAYEPPQG